MSALEDFLAEFTLVLQDATAKLRGPLNDERISTLTPSETLPENNKKLWDLLAQTVNMADQIVHLLQPPAIRLAETYLGKTPSPPLNSSTSHHN